VEVGSAACGSGVLVAAAGASWVGCPPSGVGEAWSTDTVGRPTVGEPASGAPGTAAVAGGITVSIELISVWIWAGERVAVDNVVGTFDLPVDGRLQETRSKTESTLTQGMIRFMTSSLINID
jgi:hypothetical protein